MDPIDRDPGKRKPTVKTHGSSHHGVYAVGFFMSTWGVNSNILGKSIKEIAEAEGVHEESVRQSIKRGLERMKKTF